MTTLCDSWPACLADPFLGVAFFDGIRIDSDRITDPRWDRVLPILPEEQILMCRIMKMRGLLKPGLRVLDVGTGSGVFAIWAAAHGCHVTALDYSPRALRFTRHNMDYPSNREAMEAAGGTVTTVLQDFRVWSAQATDRFDLVFLAPPYNPTADGVLAACHAEAGPLGQSKFEEQLPIAWRLLKEGGSIVCNHMAFHRKNAADAWWRHQVESMKSGDAAAERSVASVAYAPILQQPEYSARRFLEEQYAHYLEPALGLHPPADRIRKYIEKCLEDGSDEEVFGLYYFEVLRAFGVADDASGINRFTLDLRPPEDWRGRIALHRRIVEHTSSLNSIPSPALFLENDFTPSPPHFSVGLLPSVVSEPHDRQLESSIHSSILKWVLQSRLAGAARGDNDSQETSFDVVLVDIGPWFETWEGRAGLFQEALLCVSGNTDSAPTQLLDDYQINTKSQQMENLGPFLHPHFTGASSRGAWPGVQYHVIDDDTDGSLSNDGGNSERVNDWLCRLESRYQQLTRQRTSQESQEEMAHPVQQSQTLGARAAWVRNSLERLAVPDIASYLQRIQKDYVFDSITNAETELLRRDLELLHITFHKRLRRILSPAIEGGDSGLDQGAFASALVGLPLALGSSDTASSESGIVSSEVPRTFRGGIWVFAATRGKIGPREESLLFDLGRLSSILAQSSLEAKATRSLIESLRKSHQATSAHEVQTLIDGISAESPAEVLVFLRQYFRMMTISREDFLRSELLDVWARIQSGCPPGFAKGTTCKEFVTNHWRIACQASKIRWQIKTKDWIGDRVYPILDIAADLQIHTSFVLGSRPTYPHNIAPVVFFSLALIAAFRNLLEHCSNKTPVRVEMVNDCLRVVNRRLLVSGEPIRGGTERVLRFWVEGYAAQRSREVRFDPNDEDGMNWETQLPLPCGFGTSSSGDGDERLPG